MIDPRSRTLSRAARPIATPCACLASSQRRRGPEPAACVVRDPKGGEILVRAIEVDGMSVFAPADGRAVLLLLKRRVLDPVAALAARSSLTAAESAIVASLRAGGSVAEIAQARGVRPDTIRTQLKSIYLKTGASGQRGCCRASPRSATSGRRTDDRGLSPGFDDRTGACSPFG
ncbi:helix-turn-helix transcriptional regulator [Chenggangzhangella methanolivorans]|uniref:Helix-turn-helix transcriptional regulator n=1 Tax=Chenggangzhangella methanolivorans TaxID=1437009 RepID=A0A9E6RG65_9HYPH|nr:helix-turn-helix transcriptional regulator [Chenggangzhangella methanolivorans]QZO00397.1 helix-turn-helix transcriptional regulator [Chenggangzhangella methanolivorans]